MQSMIKLAFSVSTHLKLTHAVSVTIVTAILSGMCSCQKKIVCLESTASVVICSNIRCIESSPQRKLIPYLISSAIIAAGKSLYEWAFIMLNHASEVALIASIGWITRTNLPSICYHNNKDNNSQRNMDSLYRYDEYIGMSEEPILQVF